MTKLTIGVNDWSALGVVAPVGAEVVLQLVKPVMVDGRLVTTEAWSVRVDAAGNASTELPMAEVGNGVELRPRMSGVPAFTIAGYAAAEEISLVDALTTYQVDRDSLEPLASAPDAWWSALATLQEQVDAIDPSAGGGGGVTDEQLADAIAGLYTKPVGGIPKTDLAAAVQTSLGKADSATQGGYVKPAGGIPGLDLTAAIRASLGLADTALQSIPSSYATDTEVAAAVTGLAPLDSPALSGTPTVPTAAPGTNSPQAASTAFVRTELNALVAGAPGALDTLKEIADQLASDESAVGALTTAVGTKVPQSRTVNGKPLTADVSLGASDVGAAPTVHTHTASQISDASVVGRQVLTAADAAAARSAIGAGTSSLALGTSSSTAKPGDWKPTAADVSDGTAVGRGVLTAASADAGRQALNVYALAAGASVAGLPANSIIVQATGA
jgi:hypothetical protein